MSNVVNLHKNQENEEDVIREAKEQGYNSFVVVAFPDNIYENETCFLWTNFQSSILEITAMDVCKDFLQASME